MPSHTYWTLLIVIYVIDLLTLPLFHRLVEHNDLRLWWFGVTFPITFVLIASIFSILDYCNQSSTMTLLLRILVAILLVTPLLLLQILV